MSMSAQKTTYEPGTDPRNMTRSTLLRHLRKHVSGTPESKTLKRRIFDDWTTGWKVHWTNSRYAEAYVSWENGSTIGDRARQSDQRNAMRTAALDEIEAVLRSLGYVTKRETNIILVLRRMGAVRTDFAIEADPGRCTASFPIYETYSSARAAADAPALHRPGIPDPRILIRTDGGPWTPAPGDVAGARFTIPADLNGAGLRGVIIGTYFDSGFVVRLDDNDVDTVLSRAQVVLDE